MDYGVLTFAELLAIVDAEITALGVTCEIGLFTGALVPTADTTLDDLVAAEPTADWYARLPAVIDPVHVDSAGNIVLSCECVVWPYSGTDPSETITGWFWKIIDASPPDTGRVVGARRLAQSQTMGSVLNQVRVEPAFAFPPVVGS